MRRPRGHGKHRQRIQREREDRRRRGAGAESDQQFLDRVRIESAGGVLTTILGMLVADNQNSHKAGLRDQI